MRINRYVALATGLSRRSADNLIFDGKVMVNNVVAKQGQNVELSDQLTLNGDILTLPQTVTLLMNKPPGYVCSRNGQGNKTIYDILPAEYHNLKSVGRLDKESSGLLVLTNDGELAYQLTHPTFNKTKIYTIELHKNLHTIDRSKIEKGVMLEDGLSALKLSGNNKTWTVTMSEGRNRQIRRTFEKLGYRITKLHRTNFGAYSLSDITSGNYIEIVVK